MADYVFKDHTPSAMRGDARLRGRERIISSKTMRCAAPPRPLYAPCTGAALLRPRMRPCRGAEALGYARRRPPARAMANYVFKDHTPSAMRGDARLRGRERIMYSKTIHPRLCEATPACAGYGGLFVRRPSARRRRSPMGYCLSAIPQPHGKLSYRLLAIGYRLSAIGYGMRSPPARNANSNDDPIAYRLSPIAYRLSCNADSMTHCNGAH
jgi:hypothetical protein